MQFAALYPSLYQIFSSAFPRCLWAGDRRDRVIALSFDDGPHPTYTPQLLEVLDRHQIQASFFMLGACIAAAPAIANQVAQRGHWIGLHGYTHKSFVCLSASQLKQTLVQTQAALTKACSLQPESVRDVRPPNGLFTPQTIALLHQWNYRPVMWSVVPEDWVHPGISTVVQRVLKQTQNGSLIVLHDGFYGGRDVAATADRLIPQLQDQGFRFVTVDALWQTTEGC